MFDEDGSAWQMSHIELGQKADVLLIAPATANIIANWPVDWRRYC